MRHPGTAAPTGRAPAGFTLTEVVAALAVIMITALGVVSGMGRSHFLDGDSSNRFKAQALAQRLTEELRCAPFDDLVPTYDSTQVDEDGLRAVIRVVQIRPVTGVPSLLTLQVTVTHAATGDALARLVTLRSDQRAPRSAWLWES